jgi:hypothetical protein
MPCVWRLPLRTTSCDAMVAPNFSMYQSLPVGTAKREERKNDSGRRVAVLLMI